MEEYKKLLKEVIAFESISTDPKYMDGIEKTVSWIVKLLDKNGFEAESIEGYGNPVVYGSYEVSSDAETVMVYGHYDVQPASKADGWKSEPFELTERDGKLWARGIVDNKGQFLMHMVSVFNQMKAGTLKYNVKFLIEGNEETGGAGLDKLIAKEKEKFASDYIMISDGELPYKPVMTASFRGTFNASLRVTTAANNLHSGLYGGAVPSASIEISKLIAKMYDDGNKITIPGFYEGLKDMSEKEVKLATEMDAEKASTLEATGVKKLFGESFCSTVGFDTMFTVSGLQSGYTDNGYSNIVPATAEVKLNFRIAEGQTSEQILKVFTDYVKGVVPEYVDVEVFDVTDSVDAIKVDLSSDMHQATIKLLEKVYGDEVLVDYCGATIPIVSDMKVVFGVDPLLVSLGNDDCNMHGVDENFDIGLIEKGLDFCNRFFAGEASK